MVFFFFLLFFLITFVLVKLKKPLKADNAHQHDKYYKKIKNKDAKRSD